MYFVGITPHIYICQVNGIKLADILFSLLSVGLPVCVCAHSVLADICTLWAPSCLLIYSLVFLSTIILDKYFVKLCLAVSIIAGKLS